MELLFTWIKGFRNIKNQGFNFSSKFMVTFDEESKVLSISKAKNDLLNFFGENITSVTGIVGANGVGKSNILSWIKINLANFEKGAAVTWHESFSVGIIVFDGAIFCHESIKLKSIENENRKVALKTFSHYLDTTLDHDSPLENITYIFYSNIFDYNDEPQLLNLINISTNYLTKHDKYSDPKYNSGNNENSLASKIDCLDVYHVKEVERQLDFINGYRNQSLPFNLPEELWIFIDGEDMNNNLKIDYEWFEKNGLKKLRDFLYDFKNPFEEIKDRKLLLKSLFAYNYLKVIAYKYPEEFKRQNNTNNHHFYQFVYQFKNDFKFANTELNQKMDLIGEFLKTLDQLSVKFPQTTAEKRHEWNDYNSFYLSVNKKTKENIAKLMFAHDQITEGKSFMNFSWRGLSSGEKSLFSIFARFYSVLSNRLIKERKFIKILIDEGETYFHPKWQKRYVKDILSFIQDIFKKKSIQVILTSNSPFIVSDLPKRFLTFLDRNEKGECIVSDLRDHKETFGANIHSLLTDSFFMDSLLSDFAKDKIDDLINYLTGKKSNVKDDKEAITILGIIGEPLLRNQIQKLYDSQLIKSTEANVNRLERRINALEKGLKKKK